jgi:hypothetical protein
MNLSCESGEGKRRGTRRRGERGRSEREKKVKNKEGSYLLKC